MNPVGSLPENLPEILPDIIKTIIFMYQSEKTLLF